MSPWISDLYLRSQTDTRLLTLTRDGHDRAFAVLAERYRAELLGQARRLSSSGNAEDLVQQTMLSAFAALNRGAEVGHARGWLHAILRNAATRARGPIEAPLDLAVETGEGPDTLLDARADARLVLSALDELPTRQRKALVGSTVQGLSRAELATTLGVSEGAVRQLVHRARATVRAAITSLTPYPVVRWLAGAGGSTPSGSSELALATGAAGAGGIAAKLGMVAAAGAIAASGLAATGHDAPGAGSHAGHRIHATSAPGATVAAVAAVHGSRGGPVAGVAARVFVTGPARSAGGRGASLGSRHGIGRAGARADDRRGRRDSAHDGARHVSSPASGGSGSGRDGGSHGGNDGGPPNSSSGSDGSSGRGSGSSGSGSGSNGSGSGSNGSGSGSGGSGSGSGDTTTTAAGNLPAPGATTASDDGSGSGSHGGGTSTSGGGGGSGRGGASDGGTGSGTATSGSGTGTDGSQSSQTSTSSSGSRDLLPLAGSSAPTDH